MTDEPEKLAPLERGTLFEAINVTNNQTTPTCILPQGQSFRGEIKLLNVLSDPNNSGTLYVGSQGICQFPLKPGIGIVYENVNPLNLFFTGYGVSGMIIHATGGGIV